MAPGQKWEEFIWRGTMLEHQPATSVGTPMCLACSANETAPSPASAPEQTAALGRQRSATSGT